MSKLTDLYARRRSSLDGYPAQGLMEAREAAFGYLAAAADGGADCGPSGCLHVLSVARDRLTSPDQPIVVAAPDNRDDTASRL